VRWPFLIHRYLGIALGLVMASWCLSGVVMMYVSYPQLPEASRIKSLSLIDWSRCCKVRERALADTTQVIQFEVEMLAGRPVLRTRDAAGGPTRLIDLTDGSLLPSVSARQAETVAASYCPGGSQLGLPRLEGVIYGDQWTVAGSFDSDRPLYRFLVDEATRTELYVSSRTGKAMQITTVRERFWNWLGAVPHWLYFESLRRNRALWSQVVVYTALAGCVLTLLGVYVGLRQFLGRPSGRWSPYRGILFWHHVPGLIFGILLLTWVMSGLFSMNPWGFLQTASAEPEQRALRGRLPTGAELKDSLHALAARSGVEGAVSIQSALLRDRVYFVATTARGVRARLNAQAALAPLTRAEVVDAAAAIAGDGRLVDVELLTVEDTYYFGHHQDTVALPVYRVEAMEETPTRYYLDSVSGALLEKVDGNGKAYRWLHQGLHRMDFAPSLRRPPIWDVLMLLLLSGVATICMTGTYVGLRRLARRPAPSVGPHGSIHDRDN
jgi:hypothetical protein